MIFLRLFFVLLCVDVCAQGSKDSLIKFSDLNFRAPSEMELFERYLQKNDTTVLLELFLTPLDVKNSISLKNAAEKINYSVDFINQKYASTKTNAKRVKLTYDYVHKTFFKMYKLNNSFGDIFSLGEYNCVSASALYAFIFSRTNIPFSIKEKPTHVYLYAYPKAEKILIETTSPEFGYYQFSSQFVDKYIDGLYKSKQIPKQEYDSETVNDLFNKYFFTDKDITLRQLLGLQFFNFGIFNSDKKQYKEALEWFKKAYIIYPSRSIFFVMQNTLYEELSNIKYKDYSEVKNFVLLIKLAEYEKDESLKNAVVDEFVRIKEAQLINANDIDLFRKSYNFISSELKDTVLKEDIDFIYWYEMSRVSTLSGNTDSIDTYLFNAYTLRPNNVDLRSLITRRAFMKVSNYSDSKKIYDDLNLSIKIYPFLTEHNSIREVLNNCSLDMAYQFFATQKPAKGEEYLAVFEKGATQYASDAINERYVERSYSEACAFYYRIGNKSKANSMLQRGLRYAPNNFGLKQRLRQIN